MTTAAFPSEDSGIHRALVRHAKWILPAALGVAGTGVGWLVKSASSGAVLEERVEVLRSQSGQVAKNKDDIAALRYDVSYIREGMNELKQSARDINEKLSALNVTGQNTRRGK